MLIRNVFAVQISSSLQDALKSASVHDNGDPLSLSELPHVCCCWYVLSMLRSRNFVTGFAKRKQQRREYGAIQLAKKQRVARNAARKEVWPPAAHLSET
jgi:hypothetical protein